MAEEDLYELLQVHPRADQEAIAAAYARLRDRYSPARLEGMAEELQLLARQKRDAIEHAYAVLSDQARRAAYNSSLANVPAAASDQASQQVPEVEPLLDYRPLPPARRAERPRGFDAQPTLSPDPTKHVPSKVRATNELIGWIGGMLLVTVLLSVWITLSGILAPPPPPATSAQVTPQALPFDQFEEGIAQARQLTEQDPNNPQAWISYGNMLYNSAEIVRENDSTGVLYQQRLPRWLQATEAYSRALALAPTNADVRADLGVSMCFYGAGNGDQQYVRRGIAEVRQAAEQTPDTPRVLLSLGHCLISEQPPQTSAALASWQQLLEVAPESPLAPQARQLIQQFAR